MLRRKHVEREREQLGAGSICLVRLGSARALGPSRKLNPLIWAPADVLGTVADYADYVTQDFLPERLWTKAFSGLNKEELRQSPESTPCVLGSNPLPSALEPSTLSSGSVAPVSTQGINLPSFLQFFLPVFFSCRWPHLISL